MSSLAGKHINSVLSLSIHTGRLVSCSSSDSRASPKRSCQVLIWNIENVNQSLNPIVDLVSATIGQRLLPNILYNCYVVDLNQKFIVTNLSNNMIVLSRLDETIKVINGDEVDSDGRPVDVTYLKLNNEHNLLISGFKNGAVKIHELVSFNCVRINRLHSGQIICIGCDERYLLAASYEYFFVLFDH